MGTKIQSQIENTRLMTSKNAAKYLCISERKLWDMTKTGEIPAVRLGRAVRYDRSDLDDFIQRAKDRFANG
ncbi:MAG: helix-turn-helix domain-containing protein [Sedimentisphaerales bacterium]|nr:helix-turn-helix domain-containing protein [Sedimentisphaerales bacterium]